MLVAEAGGSSKPTRPETTVRPERPVTPPRAESPEMPAEAEVELSPAAQEPPVLSDMTEEEQYAYLEEVVTQTAGDDAAWRTGPNEVNLIGLRSFENEEAVEGEGNTYDDTIYAAWVDEEGQVHVESFQATTDAGVNTGGTGWGYTDAQGNYLNFSHLADGHYEDTWTVGAVNGETGLRQSAEIQIHADANNDGVIQDSERLGADRDGDGLADGVTVGAGWAIQFHRGGSAGTAVNTWSAGCQVIVDEDYDRFVEVINGASNTSFSYTLIDSSSLPGGGGTLPAAPATDSASPATDSASPATGSASPAAASAAPATGSAAPAAGSAAPATGSAAPAAGSAAPATGSAAPATGSAAPAAGSAAPAAGSAAPAAPAAPQQPADTPVPNDLATELEIMAGRPMPTQFDLLLSELLASLLNAWSPARMGSAWGMAFSLQSATGQSLTMLEMTLLRALNMGVAVDPTLRAAAGRFLAF